MRRSHIHASIISNNLDTNMRYFKWNYIDDDNDDDRIMNNWMPSRSCHYFNILSSVRKIDTF